jgi:hypothetical protein
VALWLTAAAAGLRHEVIGSFSDDRQQRRSVVGRQPAVESYSAIAFRPVAEVSRPPNPLCRISITGRGGSHVSAAIAQCLDGLPLGEAQQRRHG